MQIDDLVIEPEITVASLMDAFVRVAIFAQASIGRSRSGE